MGQRLGVVKTSPANHNSNNITSIRQGSLHQHRSHHDLLIESGSVTSVNVYVVLHYVLPHFCDLGSGATMCLKSEIICFNSAEVSFRSVMNDKV